MDAYELDRIVTNAIDNIIKQIRVSNDILEYAVEPADDYEYSVPLFIDSGDASILIHYLVYVNALGDNISLKFQFDGVLFENAEINNESDFITVIDCVDTILNTIDTDNEIYI